MTSTGVQQMEQNIARCRLVLSLAAIVAMYADPAEPLLARWIPMVSGPFVMDFRLLLVMALHLAYSVSVYVSLSREWVSPQRVVAQTMWIDVLFGAVIGTLTEGATSPAYLFFAFAVVAAGLRAGLRQAIWVTAASAGLYICLIVLSVRGGADVYIMRPVYLAITGYLVGSLGQQRLDLQEEMRQLEVTEQRHRIARDLHDNFAQALAGINLRLEGCRRQLHANPAADLLPELTELQASVKRESEELRTYTRSLAGLEVHPTPGDAAAPARLWVSADLSGSFDLVDHILQIAREGISNVRRHARAKTAKIEIRTDQSNVHVSIEDDGVGFQADATPWSIASRVREIGGHIQIVGAEGRGAHLLITVPQG
jgi:signal transduction histidine kinase